MENTIYKEVAQAVWRAGMPLTKKEIAELAEIIDKAMNLIIVNVGPAQLKAYLLAYRINQIIKKAKNMKELRALIESIKQPSRLTKWTTSQVLNEISKMIGVKPPNLIDKEAIDYLQRYQFSEITWYLDNMRNKIRHEMTEALMQREHPVQVARRLHKVFNTYKYDMRRVAITETTRARNKASLIRLKQEDPRGENALIYFLVAKDACDECKRLYLHPDKKTPRIFRVKDIENKSNKGLPKAQWQAALIIHPHERCMPLPYNPELEEWKKKLWTRIEGTKAQTLKKALAPGTGEPRPGHKYLRRVWNPQRMKYDYIYEEPTAETIQKEKIETAKPETSTPTEEQPKEEKPKETIKEPEREELEKELQHYKRNFSGFLGINQYLREKERNPEKIEKETEESIRKLDRIIEYKNDIKEDTTLHRGTDDPRLNELKPGDTFIEPGYTSTSTKIGVAERFKRAGFSHRAWRLIIDVPKGVKGTSVPDAEGTPMFEREHEVLLQRGLKFKVIWINRKTRVMKIQAQLPDLNKALGEMRPGHKYIRREGSPGGPYRYIYEETKNKINIITDTYNRYRAYLTAEERNAIRDYKGSYYKEINEALRDPEYFSEMTEKYSALAEKVKKNIELIHKSMIGLPTDLTVYRAAQIDTEKIKEGTILNDKAFVSTSMDKELAKKRQKDNDGNALFILNVPKGTKALYLEGFNKIVEKQYGNEQEILLHKDLNFKITKYKDLGDGTWEIKAQVIE